MKKKDFKYVVKVLTLIFVISITADRIIAKFTNDLVITKMKGNESFAKVNTFLNCKDTMDYIFFGSSHIHHGIKPQVMKNKKIYNAGFRGHFLLNSKIFIKTLDNNPQTVFLELMLDNAFKGIDRKPNLNLVKQYYHNNDKLRFELEKFGVKPYLFNLELYEGKIFDILEIFFLFKNKTTIDYFSGYAHMPIGEVIFWERLSTKEKLKRINTQINRFKYYEKKIDKFYEKQLDEIIEFCKVNNKKLVTFSSPIYKDIGKHFNVLIAKIMKEKGVEYHDYTDFFNGKNKLEYWVDYSHLSEKGAELFTKEIDKLIERKTSP